MKNYLYIDLKHKTFYYKINIKLFNMDLVVRAYIKGDTHKGSEKQNKNVCTKINLTYAIPCNDIIACRHSMVIKNV